MSYQAEYIWIDGTEPSPLLRSKTRIIPDGKKPGIWGFDGSSTNQATGDNSDCVLNPVFTCPDPLRGPDDILVMCEVLMTDMTPHPTNTRAACAAAAESFGDMEPWFGIEQEYTFMKGGRPLGWPEHGYPAPQGPYYCGVGGDKMPGRSIVERHTMACMDAGLAIEGTNAEVMMGQWEFQIGILPPPTSATSCGWPAGCCSASPRTSASSPPSTPSRCRATGTGPAPTPTSPPRPCGRRVAGTPSSPAARRSGRTSTEHVENYGVGITERLTGAHETAHWSKFSYGTSDRGASIRIPWAVALDKKGWLEDRRPNANMDPYVVTRLLVNTVCSRRGLSGRTPGPDATGDPVRRRFPDPGPLGPDRGAPGPSGEPGRGPAKLRACSATTSSAQWKSGESVSSNCGSLTSSGPPRASTSPRPNWRTSSTRA